MQRMIAPMPDFTPAPVKPPVPIAALEALDIRVGEIIGVENVTGSSKLVRLRVSFGDHERSILRTPNMVLGRRRRDGGGAQVAHGSAGRELRRLEAVEDQVGTGEVARRRCLVPRAHLAG